MVLGQAAARAPAPIEDGAGPEPSPVVAYATLDPRSDLSGPAAQLAKAGGDRSVIVRDPFRLPAIWRLPWDR